MPATFHTLHGSVPPCKSVIGLLPREVKCNGTGRTVFFSAYHFNPVAMCTACKALPGGDAIRKALLASHEDFCVLNEMVAATEAIISFAQCANTNPAMADVLEQLKKQFYFYANLAEGERK